MKKAFLISFTLFSLLGKVEAQEVYENKEKSSTIISDLFYDEFYMGIKCYQKITLEYRNSDGKIIINEIGFFGDDKNLETKTEFYIEDLDLTSMHYDRVLIQDSLYSTIVEIKAKDKTIQISSVNTNLDKFPMPVSDSNYTDKLIITSAKLLPKRLSEKFVNNIAYFLGVKEFEYKSIFKSRE